nr:type III secretion protein [Pseudomonas khavaziana]
MLGLALASPEQIDLAVALLDLTCHPNLHSPLCDEHRKWCERLAKALHPEALLQPDDDPLQLLRAWVKPAVWQRLRLRLAPDRVQSIERTYLSLDDAHGRLNTLWQAIAWRIAATNSEVTHH